MIFYNSIFFFILICSLLNLYLENQKYKNLINIIVLIVLVFFAGSRINIGGDWHNYLDQFKGFSEIGFPSVAIFKASDPFYILLNVISFELNWGLVGANYFCALFFFLGAYIMLSRYKNFSFGILVNYLFLFLILSMGFTRQSLSVGFIYFFLYFFIEKKNIPALLCFLISLASHKTSAIFFVIFFSYIFIKNLINSNNYDIYKLIKLKKIWFLIFSILLFSFFFLYRDIERLIGVYIFSELDLHSSLRQQRTSPGLIYKYPIFIIISFVYYFFRDRLEFKNSREKNVFDIYFILIILPIPFSGFFSLLVDRVLIYSYFFVSLFLCKLINQDFISKKNMYYIFFISSFFSLFLLNFWLVYSNHSSYWLPYTNLYFSFN